MQEEGRKGRQEKVRRGEGRGGKGREKEGKSEREDLVAL